MYIKLLTLDFVTFYMGMVKLQKVCYIVKEMEFITSKSVERKIIKTNKKSSTNKKARK